MRDISPKKGYGYIYKYTSPSGKSYVGQTKFSLNQRSGKRGQGYKGCPLFYQAIQKYGFENFEVEILAEVKIEQLDEAEHKYIHLFNTLEPNGYNKFDGAPFSGVCSTKKVYQYSMETGEFLKEYDSVREAAEELNLNYNSLNSVIGDANYAYGGYCWSRVKMKKYPIHERLLSPKEKEVEMYDYAGNLLMTFPSIAKAAEYVNGTRSPIKKVCRGELQSAYGYRWKCTEVLMEKKYNNTAKQVLKLDKNTNEVIEVFPSISAAAHSLNKETSLIRRVLDKDDKTAYGFKWKTAQGSTTTYS